MQIALHLELRETDIDAVDIGENVGDQQQRQDMPVDLGEERLLRIALYDRTTFWNRYRRHLNSLHPPQRAAFRSRAGLQAAFRLWCAVRKRTGRSRPFVRRLVADARHRQQLNRVPFMTRFRWPVPPDSGACLRPPPTASQPSAPKA